MKKKVNLFAALLLAAAGAAYSQTITGSVTGTVTDASGATAPNVKITVTNTGTGVANTTQTNNYILQRVDINQSVDNQIGYQPNVDALEEVKVVTGNAGAEFGNVGGASVVMSLKSGTNQYHGNVFEFLRNDKFDANGFFNNRNNVKKQPLRQNIFGGTFGGPMQHNRTSFFSAYEQTE